MKLTWGGRWTNLLNLEMLEVAYGPSRVINGVSLHVRAGEVVALVGTNGAGKSSLMGALAGLNTVKKGKVSFCGEDITHKHPHEIVAKGISLVPERREIFDALTVKDNLILGSFHRYQRDKAGIQGEIEQVLELFPALKGKEKRFAGSLSGGEQQMLAIGRALMAKPKLLLLDEPSIGLAPIIIQEIFRIIADLRDMGTTIFLVEQNAQLALRYSNRAYVLERGEIVLAGDSADLLKDERIAAAYLGKGQTKRAL